MLETITGLYNIIIAEVWNKYLVVSAEQVCVLFFIDKFKKKCIAKRIVS